MCVRLYVRQLLYVGCLLCSFVSLSTLKSVSTAWAIGARVGHTLPQFMLQSSLLPTGAIHSDHKEVSRSAAILWCMPILSRPPACLLHSRCTVEMFPCKILREPLHSPVRDMGAHSPARLYAIPVTVHGSTGIPLLLRRCLMLAKGECPKQFTIHLPVHVGVRGRFHVREVD